ncbi:MAG TPA: protein-S-isoprenylcysteine O-methyltransferase [Gemmatimonadales bacterium]|nr:protein-S-isoprenylcysteine O-methyltransferase [Gemmatimonadales bacterium]
MSPWFAKAAVLAAAVGVVLIRMPHMRRNRRIRVARSRTGPRETVRARLSQIAFAVPLIWIATPLFAFADYRLQPWVFAAGILCLAASLTLFYRSHADLAEGFSSELEVREQHRLVTGGVYGRVRHPMYLAFLLLAVSGVLVIPNWVAGPSYLILWVAVLALRIGPEEQMMIEEFGPEYEAYVRRTKRLIPGIW